MKIKSSSALFNIEVIGGQLAPQVLLSPSVSNKNLYIEVLVKIIQRFDDNNSGIETPPRPGASVVSYAFGTYKVFVEEMVV